MYSTPKKRLFELKKELMQLKRKMDKKAKIAEKKGEIPCSFGMEYEYGNWDSYSIFTSDGIEYLIDCTTRYFPNIDFKKIVYINKSFQYCAWKSKKTGKWQNNKAWYSNYDSFTGFYQSRDNYEYYLNMYDRYKINSQIYTGTD